MSRQGYIVHGMRTRRLSLAAILGLTAALVLTAYIFRDVLGQLVLGGVAARLGYGWLRHRLGIRPRARTGKSFWEVAAAAVGGYLLGRRKKDTVAQAVASGAELQVIVKPKPSRYRT